VTLDAKKLILAASGLILLHLGWSGLSAIFPGSSAITPAVLGAPAREFPADRASFVAALISAPLRIAEPARHLVAPLLAAFSPSSDTSTFVHAMLAAVWGAIVWGTAGGAIARIALAEVAASERIGLSAAVQFAARSWVPLGLTPLGPLIGVGFFAALCGLFGLLYWIPAPIGPTAAGVLAFLPLLAGWIMAIIVLGLAVGWPLMPVTVAAEDEDGFDAMSRSYAYVQQRPGRYAAYTALAWGIGTLGLVVVDLVARTVVHLAHWGLSFGAPRARLEVAFGTAPTAAAPTAAALHAAWISLVGLLAHGWVYAYFWTAAAIIYLLLRHDVDGTAWNQIDWAGQPVIGLGLEPEPTSSSANEPSGAPSSKPSAEEAVRDG
jgi:hypothetical protein